MILLKIVLTFFLPDQDVLNALYGHLTLQTSDELYNNYDVAGNVLYYARNKGEWDLDWVIKLLFSSLFVAEISLGGKDYHGHYAAL